MHQVSTIQGSMSFITNLARRLRADGVDPAQHHHLVGQQLLKIDGIRD